MKKMLGLGLLMLTAWWAVAQLDPIEPELAEPLPEEEVKPVEPEPKQEPPIIAIQEVYLGDKEPPVIEQKPVTPPAPPFVLDVLGNGEITKTQKAPLTPEQEAAAWTPTRPAPAPRPAQPTVPSEKTPEQEAAEQALRNENALAAKLHELETQIATLTERIEELEKAK